MADVHAAVAKDKAVKEAREALDAARKARDLQDTKRTVAEIRAAQLRQEIKDVVREGDTKADVVALHAELTLAEAAIQQETHALAPLEGAVTVKEKLAQQAVLAVIARYMIGARKEAGTIEEGTAEALDWFDREMANAEALLTDHSQAVALWCANGGAKGDSTLDLGSFELSEIRGLRRPHSPISVLRDFLHRVFSRSRRHRPAA